MKFERIRVERAPGVDQPFELTELGSGFNVILGPNGSGKSLLCRIVRGLLWSSSKARGTVASAQLSTENGRLAVRRDEDQVEWSSEDGKALEPRLPGEHLSGCFLLHAGDLLSTGAQTDREIALEIRKQMAGGYDLDVVRTENFSVTPLHGKNARRSFDDAQRALARVREEFRGLAQEEESLVDLEQRILAAKRAAERVRLLENLRELAGEREQLALLDARASALPPGMEKISGAEGDNLSERDDVLAAQVEALEAAQLELERKRTELAECRPDGAPTRPEVLAAWIKRAGLLQRLEERCSELTSAAAEAAAALADARIHLAGEHGLCTEKPPTAALLAELDEHLRQATNNREALAKSEARLAALANQLRDGSEPSARDVERALDALRDWSANPVAERELARQPLLWSLALLFLGAGAFLGRTEDTSWFALAGAGAALSLWAYSIGASSRNANALRSEAVTAYPARDVEPPEEWNSNFVQERLAELEEELFEARTGEQVERDRDFLAQRLDELEVEARTLEDARRRLAQQAGVDLETTDLSLAETARRLAELSESSVRSREADAVADAAQLERRAATRKLAAWLTERGYECTDATESLEALRSLEERMRAAARCEEEIAELESRLPRLEAAIETGRARVRRTFAEAGLEDEDRPGLEKRLAALKLHQSLDRDCRVHRAQIERLTRLLPEGQAELTAEEAEVALEEVVEEAAQYESLVAEREAAKQRLESARSGTRMEDAIDAALQAKDVLTEQHEEALDACLGSFLVRAVGEEYRRHSSPHVLQEAVRLFSEFTQQRYELLLFESEEATRFRARDVLHGQVLGLSQLSDGTRMQLLLAARFAFALDVEDGQVPFFLDEALSFSDPARFGEIARVLFTLVEEGRQVFYLTSSPAEVNELAQAAARAGCKPPRVHDLSLARGQESLAQTVTELEYELIPALPPVGQDSAAQYGLRINAPFPAPGSKAEALHLFHLLRDELELLRRLVGAGCVSVGQWEVSVRTGAASALVVEDERIDWLSARCEVAHAVFEAWQIGRGRPIGRTELVESGAVSERYLDPFSDMVTEVGGSVTRFLELLGERQDERTKKFQKKKQEELTQWFEEQDYLDRRLQLDLDEARRRVQSAMVGKTREGVLTLEEIVALTSLVWSALESGDQKRSSRLPRAETSTAHESA